MRAHHRFAWFAILMLSASLPGCQDAKQPVLEPAQSASESRSSEPVEQTAKSPQDGPAKVHRKHGEPNRLASETSPYLLMHAHNPVDWYPWGEEALAKARREGKLIFLSIGYSSCYWCHVMERESFLNEEVAKILNEHFVAIKVDREERPDVDEIYMQALHLRGRRGGWPLSIFLTPDAKPIDGGTYFPQANFLSILKDIDSVWQAKPENITSAAEQLTAGLRRALDQTASLRLAAKIPLEVKLLDNVQAALAEDFDPKWGGFGYSERESRMPKFPTPSRLLFLLRRAETDNGTRGMLAIEARRMLAVTLDKMAIGGIRDHLGGGFHRYSTDRFWHIPHFEKMLYDNGQLATVYAEAYALTGQEEYRLIVEQMLDFVLRDMTGEGGGFYAAIDAETDAEEGKYYRWNKEEISPPLTEAETLEFSAIYGFDGSPNFEQRYFVPLLERLLSATAAERETTLEQLESQLGPLRVKLLEKRRKREHPLIDTKVITAWNGLMIRGFADAGRVLQREDYVKAASRAAEFVLAKLRTDDGRLLRTFRSGEAKLNAYLDDYAFLVDGLIALHRATGAQRWLEEADALTQKQMELFWDDKAGGFYFTSHDHESLVARAKSPSDSVMPSGNAVAVGNLIYLGEHLKKSEYFERARKAIAAFSVYLAEEEDAGSVPRMAIALDSLLEVDPPQAPSPPEADSADLTEGSTESTDGE